MNAQEATVFLENKKELEKYKAMWEELPNMLESQFHNWDFSVLVKNMEELEQKYFPKEGK